MGLSAMAEPDEPVPEKKLGPWVREGEEATPEEEERNAEQAERNAKMRDRLRERRQEKAVEPEEEAPPPFEDFMGCEALPSVAKTIDENLPPWFVMRPHIDNVALRLHEELLDFASFMKHQRWEVEARRQWVRQIAVACRGLWPKCDVRVFGSFFTGLSLPNGDVDVAVLDVPCKPATAMKMLADKMLEAGEISWLEIIESAKVPVCKMRSQSVGLRADVVFNQPDGLETSRFIKEQCRIYPQMKPLLIFLKYFLLQRGLHETFTGGMGSYLCCNVVLHFLQRHPSRLDQRVYSATSLGHYLFDFFKYYGQEFKYDNDAISVVDGGKFFSPSERGWEKRAGKGKSKGKNQLCLHLESPLQRGADLGSACFRMPILRNLFHHGFHCICHLFVTQAPPEASLLSPLLLDPAHPVITNRQTLMAEQPVALAGLPTATERAEAAAEAEAKAIAELDTDLGFDDGNGPTSFDDGNENMMFGEDPEPAPEVPAKRRRRSDAGNA